MLSRCPANKACLQATATLQVEKQEKRQKKTGKCNFTEQLV